MVPENKWTDGQLRSVCEYIKWTNVLDGRQEPVESIDEPIFTRIEEMMPLFCPATQRAAEKVLHVRKLKKQAQQSEAATYEI
jgi:hypothetical protein